MPAKIALRPNVPVTLSLIDPYADSCELYDAERGIGEYRTTDGKILALPRPAVLKLNELDPQPGEEIGICRYDREWAVWLTASSEKARATAETEPSELTEALQASLEQSEGRKRTKQAVTPIRRKPAGKQDDQPRLFDRGTGTDGPAPRPAIPLPAVARKTPYPDMLRHIVRTVEQVLKAEGLQLGDGPKQDLISTVYIDAAKRSGVEYDFTREGE